MTTSGGAVSALKEYAIGDSDTRPWGEYVVTGYGLTPAGEEFCEKIITVNPGKILSLQSHDHRHEHWTVREGTLTIILDGRRYELSEGGEIAIPAQSIHTMANLGASPCIVHERQEGICREDDITRYADSYGRSRLGIAYPSAESSLRVFNDILREIG